MPRALIYARQSDTDDEGERSLSLDSQERELRDRAAREGWVVVGAVRDPDRKGYDEARPGLLALLARCQAGDAEIILVWDLSRLARSLRLQENVLHDLAVSGVELVSLREPWASQPLFRQLLGAIAEEQTRTISGHVRRALRERAARGLHHGRAPYGLIRPAPKTALAIDANHADRVAHVIELFERRATGEGISALADDFTRRGIPSPHGEPYWSRTTVYNLLANPVYRGAIDLGGQAIEGTHPAIVTPDVWNRVRAFDGVRPPRNKAARSWLEGHVRHACGEPMYFVPPPPTRPRPGFRCRFSTARAPYPRCPISPRWVDAAHVEGQAWTCVLADLERVLSPARVLDRARAEHRAASPLADRRQREVADRAQRLADRRARAEDLYLAGSRDRSWFDAEDARIGTELATVAAELAVFPESPDPDTIEASWMGLRTLRDLANVVLPEDRGAVLAELGVAVVGFAGIHRGRGDAGRVHIAHRPELARFFVPT